jgi:hypothetical protein
MLDFLKEIKDDKFDAFFFIPGPEEDTVRVEGAKYKDPGENIGGNKMGDMYHIMLFREDDQGNPTEPDLFEAILTEPLEYVSRMITCDFYGLVAKKTTTSDEFIQNTFDKLKEV